MSKNILSVDISYTTTGIYLIVELFSTYFIVGLRRVWRMKYTKEICRIYGQIGFFVYEFGAY